MLWFYLRAVCRQHQLLPRRPAGGWLLRGCSLSLPDLSPLLGRAVLRCCRGQRRPEVRRHLRRAPLRGAGAAGRLHPRGLVHQPSELLMDGGGEESEILLLGRLRSRRSRAALRALHRTVHGFLPLGEEVRDPSLRHLGAGGGRRGGRGGGEPHRINNSNTMRIQVLGAAYVPQLPSTKELRKWSRTPQEDDPRFAPIHQSPAPFSGACYGKEEGSRGGIGAATVLSQTTSIK